jgi:hypothetical protein
MYDWPPRVLDARAKLEATNQNHSTSRILLARFFPLFPFQKALLPPRTGGRRRIYGNITAKI